MDMSSGLKVIEKNRFLYTELGDCPNLEFPTNGGKLLWRDVKSKQGWRLQINYLTGLSRILDHEDIRKAWGSPVVMEEKFKRLTRSEFLEPGDVVGVVRKKALNMYEHYAVYLGDGKVVHYSGIGSDYSCQICVREDTLANFLKEDDNYFVLYFDKSFISPKKIQVKTSFNMNNVSLDYQLCLKRGDKHKVYSPRETVERALSRVGENKYNLLINNCEHFAIWCKTGVSESYQVRRAINSMLYKNPIFLP